MRKSSMPKINVDELPLNDDEKAIVRLFVRPDGHILSSKPNPKLSREHGIAAYIWREVVFLVSPIRQHHCMPVTSFMDLPNDLCRASYALTDVDARKDWKEKWEPFFKKIADAVVNQVPLEQRHGLLRWGRVLGRI